MKLSILIKEHIQRDQRRIKIAILYLVMIAGGVWHLAGMFQPLLSVLASPIIFGIGIFLVGEQFLWMLKTNSDISAIRKFVLWSILIVTFTLSIEIIGVNTGLVFGDYSYGEILRPFLYKTPVVIGFAWLSMLISSTALTRTFLRAKFTDNRFKTAFIVATVMVVFDFFMEPAAVKLGYWSWQSEIIPIKNYISWFLVSFLFSMIATKWRLFSTRLTPVAFHAFFAQLLYFILVITS